MSLYKVTGTRDYRGYQPGQTFEATLDPLAEHRATERGAIEVVDRSIPSIQPHLYTPPAGWRTQEEVGQ